MTTQPVKMLARPAIRWGLAAWLFISFAVTLAGLTRAGLISIALGDLALNVIGLGQFFETLVAAFAPIGLTRMSAADVSASIMGTMDGITKAELGLGLGGWVFGWGLIAASFSNVTPLEREPSAAVGKPLFPRLALYQDFHWGTLAAYGLGLLFAELVFVGLYTALVGKGGSAAVAPAAQAASTSGLDPLTACGIALLVAWAIAFAGGFLGAANSKRLSTPEATMALLYFGTPVPFVLTLIHQVPSLMLQVGYRLREIVYLSSMLGENRPELGYWGLFALVGLCMFLGISLGFVSTSSGQLNLRTNYERFIATRHVSVLRVELIAGVFSVLFFFVLLPLALYAIVSAAEAAIEKTRIRKLGLKDPLLAAEALNEVKLRAQTPTSLMTSLAVLGVGVGVWAMVIVLSVMSGFEADLQKKILGTNSHGIVMKYTPDMPEYVEVMEKIGTVRNVTGQTPFILNEVMISSEGNISGAMIKGIDPKTVGSVTDLPEYMLPGGSLDGLDDPSSIAKKRFGKTGALDEKPSTPGDIERDPLLEMPKENEDIVLPGIVLGRELASSLKVIVGDRLNVVSPLGGELSPQGPMPKSRPFRVAGIFYSGMFEYDSKFVYIHLREAQTFFNVKGASGVEIKVADVDNARNTMKGIYDKLEGYPYRTKDWGEMNKNLFSALRLEKLVMALILSIIVIVAAGLIVATVFMLVLEKRKEIAVLKALGVPDGGIVKIFLMEGLQIGIVGALLGLVAGLLHCLFIEKVGIKLDAQIYYIPALPVRIEPIQIAASVIVAILITFLASVYPALKAAQVEPVDGLKSE